MQLLKKNAAPLIGLAVTLAFLGMAFFRVQFLDSVELKLYDLRMSLAAAADGQSPVVLVDIDDDSIDKLGRWPWPRSVLARGLQAVDAGKPAVIGLNILLSENEENSGLKVLEELKALYDGQLGVIDMEGGEGAGASLALQAFRQRMDELAVSLDNDAMLASELSASGGAVLPMAFAGAGPSPEPPLTPDDALFAASVGTVRLQTGARIPQARQALLPIPVFGQAAKGLGHINLSFDQDGTARRDQLLYQFRGRYFPSFALRLAGAYLGTSPEQMQAILGQSVQAGPARIPTTLRGEMLVNFRGPHGAFKSYPFYDVITDKIPSSVFADKVVLIGVSAAGVVNPLSTPTDPAMPLGEFAASTVDTILSQRFIRQPPWNYMAELAAVLALGLLCTLGIPRMRAMVAAGMFVGLFGVILGGSVWAFMSQGLWVRITYPLLTLVLGYIGVISARYLSTEADKEKVEGESAETNRMLGLSFQSQGMLDMAFEKFRKVPADEDMKGVLYTLAQDFERKRQFNKAVAVYEHIERSDPKYRDVAERKKRMIQVGETLVLGAGFASSSGEGLLSGGGDLNPTLGRYEVVKQLGKGAMGVVYLGKDPRINRTTAIKTFRLNEEFEPDELEEMKKKFFQEAESAGTLNHPNIVTIYDAGEEQELAYIAMEYLEGEDLKKYAKKGNLMSLRHVVGHMANVAEALDYAHKKGIVHRDIKPANLMLLKNNVIKITDFGIARITASSQTQTGVVKGTPHYMSPEQISGQKVDGRSDIFSLGVVMYQLLTGALPFSGDNVATLMHQIMNEPHPDPRNYNRKLPTAVVRILDKALVKNRDQRYQQASQMAGHLHQVAAKLDAMAAAKSTE